MNNRNALCIGVSSYEDASVPPLPQCAEDVFIMHELLQSNDAAFKSLTLINPDSTTLREKIWDIATSTGPAGQLLLYFSGHGIRTRSRKLCLMTKNTSMNSAVLTGVTFDNIIEILREAGISTFLFILDCCYSGAAELSLFKGNEESVISEAESDLISEKGWAVLCSTNPISQSRLSPSSKTSPFTEALAVESKSLFEISNKSTITVADLYEKIRHRVSDHKPKLFGNNHLFPIGTCRASSSNSQDLRREAKFIPMNAQENEFHGLFVMPGLRAWLLSTPLDHDTSNLFRITNNIYALQNKDEVFLQKQTEAISILIDNRRAIYDLIEYIENKIIVIAFPLTIDETTSNRYFGLDRKYVLKFRSELKKNLLTQIDRQLMWAINPISTGWELVLIPEDYLKDAFGVIIDTEKHSNYIVFKEDTFSRNAKYVSVDATTNRVIEAAVIDKNRSVVKSFSNNPSEDSRIDRAIAIRHRKVHLTGGARQEDTELQASRRAEGVCVNCKQCMDERSVIVSVNLRQYRVPCPACNADKNDSWRPFWGS